MSILARVYVLCFLFCFIGCKNEHSKIQPEILKGCRVESSLTYEYGVLQIRRRYEYDAEYNLLKELYDEGDGKNPLVFDFEYERDGKGQIIKEMMKSEGHIVNYIDKTYHSNGVVKSKFQENSNYNALFEYDESGNELRELIHSDNHKSEKTRIFDSNSNVLEFRDVYYLNGTLNHDRVTKSSYENGLLVNMEFVTLHPKGNPTLVTSYEYDSARRLVLETTSYEPLRSSNTKYTYNGDGHLIKSVSYSDYTLYQTFTDYVYDGKGLITSEIQGSNEDAFRLVTEFSYFPNGALSRKVSYYHTEDVTSKNKKPMREILMDGKGNTLHDTFYDISGAKRFSVGRDYICNY